MVKNKFLKLFGKKVIKNRIYIALLLCVWILALGLRLWNLGTTPLGVTIDEASFGYIAYSISQTARDEHGHHLPLVFQAFGDQKLPAQVYLLVPLVRAFGLNNFILRFPSAFLGSLQVLLLFILGVCLGFSKKASLFGSLFYALAPATFYLSRIAFESNVGLFFFMLGLIGLTILYQSDDKIKLLGGSLLTAFGFAASWYSYISFRPITIAILVVFSIAMLLSSQRINWRSLLASWLALIILILPLFLLTDLSTFTARFTQLNNPAQRESLELQVHTGRNFCYMWGGFPGIWCGLNWNRITLRANDLARNYAHALGMNFLVLDGESGYHIHVPGFGQFALIIYLLFWLGIVVIVAEFSQNKRSKVLPHVLLLVFLLIAMTPAMLSGEPNKIRLSAAFPLIFLLAIKGADVFWAWFVQLKDFRKKIICGVVILMGMMTVFVWQQYFIHFFAYHTLKNEYFYISYAKELNEKVANLNYERVYWHITEYDNPLIFFAYYTQFPPDLFQEIVVFSEPDEQGWQQITRLGDYHIVVDSAVSNFVCGLDPQTLSERTFFVEQGTEYIQRLQSRIANNPDYSDVLIHTISSIDGVHNFVIIVDAAKYHQYFCDIVTISTEYD
ncbi:MAG: phospholipid carrier-dependent glycosyltransferase [Pseudomonadales bacterium]|nr:phospholipid carrier-dependent glycosyltransferase [Pseudomonadales bacterium]